MSDDHSSTSGQISCDEIKAEIKKLLDAYHTPPHRTGQHSTKELSILIRKHLNEMLRSSEVEDYFWHECSLEVYNKTFNQRLEKVKEIDPIYTRKQLLRDDYIVLNNLHDHRGHRDFGETYHSIINKPETHGTEDERKDAKSLREIFRKNQTNKLKYIRKELKSEGLHIRFEGDLYQIEPIENTNPYPNLFTGQDSTNSDIFREFYTNHIKGRGNSYVQWSFLIQQMREENRILRIPHVNIMEILVEMGYLSQEELQDFVGNKGKFRSLDKSSSKKRMEQYMDVKENLLNA
ncbi:hypothetical protein [Robertkochia aurantiaca]|uniref:hypothetical protein n=1 Tax=Robertkochia aurantiaca TaxID=2873700 RepID=UPI001CCC1FBD|nr:hypothetical protein [Robertkochia sp. 3YJGBD-33]